MRALRLILMTVALALVPLSARGNVVMCQGQEIRTPPGGKTRILAVHCEMAVYLRSLNDGEEPAEVQACMVGYKMIRCSDNKDYIVESAKERTQRADAERRATKHAEARRKFERCVVTVAPQGESESASTYEIRKNSEIANCLASD